MNTLNQNGLHVVLGTGPVGLTLADILLSQGKQVRVVSRSGKATVPAGVELVAADITNIDTAKEVCRGAAVVYNCVNVPYAEQVAVVPQLQAGILAGTASAGAKLVVTADLYVYGETHGQPITEDTPHAAATRKGWMRVEVAQKYRDAHRSGAVQVAIGRAADFYGPRVLNSSMGAFVFPPVLAGKPAQVMGNIRLPHSYSYIGDVARGLVTLAERPEAFGLEWLLPVARQCPRRKCCVLSAMRWGIRSKPKLSRKSPFKQWGCSIRKCASWSRCFTSIPSRRSWIPAALRTHSAGKRCRRRKEFRRRWLGSRRSNPSRLTRVRHPPLLGEGFWITLWLALLDKQQRFYLLISPPLLGEGRHLCREGY